MNTEMKQPGSSEISITKLGVSTQQATLSVLTLDLTHVHSDHTQIILTVVQNAVLALADLEGQSGHVVFDLRAALASSANPAQESTIEALRGLVQGYVAESGPRIGAVNVAITTEDQDADREATWRFLLDPDGSLARGATFDLREE